MHARRKKRNTESPRRGPPCHSMAATSAARARAGLKRSFTMGLAYRLAPIATSSGRLRQGGARARRLSKRRHFLVPQLLTIKCRPLAPNYVLDHEAIVLEHMQKSTSSE